VQFIFFILIKIGMFYRILNFPILKFMFLCANIPKNSRLIYQISGLETACLWNFIMFPSYYLRICILQ